MSERQGLHAWPSALPAEVPHTSEGNISTSPRPFPHPSTSSPSIQQLPQSSIQSLAPWPTSDMEQQRFRQRSISPRCFHAMSQTRDSSHECHQRIDNASPEYGTQLVRATLELHAYQAHQVLSDFQDNVSTCKACLVHQQTSKL